MGRIFLYSKLDDEKKIIEGTGTVGHVLRNENIDLKNCVFLANGFKVDENFLVRDDDIVFVRQVPRNWLSDAWNSATDNFGKFIDWIGENDTRSIWGAILSGGITSAIYSSRLSDKIEAQQRALENQQKKRNSLDYSTQDLPFVKGAKNSPALGNNFPFIMGEVLFAPYRLSNGFYSVSGNKQFWECLFYVSCNKTGISEVRIKDRVIHSSEAFDTFYAEAESEGDNQVRFSFENADAETHCIGQYVGRSPECKEGKKGTDEEEPVVIQCAEDILSVEAGIEFNGLRRLSSSAEWENASVSLDFELLDEDGNVVDSKSMEYSRNTNETIRDSVFLNASSDAESHNKLTLRISRSERKDSGTAQDIPVVSFVNYEMQKPVFDCQGKEWLSLYCRFLSDENTQDTLDEISVLACGHARTWSRDAKAWTADKLPTRNPAAWALEVLTNGFHGLSMFSDGEIDLLSFGALYEYCEDEKLYCDGVVTADIKKIDLVRQILSECFSTLILNDEGKYEVCIDREEINPVALINNESVTDISVEKSYERKIDGKKVTYVDHDSHEVTSCAVMKDGRTEYGQGDTITETALNFATTHAHAWKLAERELWSLYLQDKTVTVSVGMEGMYYPLFATVLLQNRNVMHTGLASTVVKAIDLNEKRIRFQDAFSLSGNRIASVQANCSGVIRQIVLTLTMEYEDWIYFELYDEKDSAYVSFIKPFDIASIDSQVETCHEMMKIVDKRCSENGFSLVLKRYDERIYRYHEGGTPIPSYTAPKSIENAINPTRVSRYDISGIYREMHERDNRTNKVLEQKSSVLKNAMETEITKLSLGSTPVYKTFIDTPIVKRLPNGNYSPSEIKCETVKEYVRKADNAVINEEFPVDWLVRINSNAEAVFHSASTLKLDIVELMTELGIEQTNSIYIEARSSNFDEDGILFDRVNIPIVASLGGLSFSLENDFQMYACCREYDGKTYPNGYIENDDGLSTVSVPHVYSGLNEIPYGEWTYGPIDVPEGFELKVLEDGKLEITHLTGDRMPLCGNIRIPIFMRTEDNLNTNVGFAESPVTWNVGFESAGGIEYAGGFTEPGEDEGYIYLSFGFRKCIELADFSQKQIDLVSSNLITTIGESYNGVFRGSFSTLADVKANCANKDFFVASGEITINGKKTSKGEVYIVMKGEDGEITRLIQIDQNPSSATYNKEYSRHLMEALPEILSNSEDVYSTSKFTVIMARQILAQQAVIDELSSKLIKLSGNGEIKSENFTENGKSGFSIKASGKAVFNDVTVRGKVDGSAITGGSISGTKISGTEITGGSVSGTTIKGGSVSGAEITGGSVSGMTITGGSISGAKISGTEITGGSVNIGNGNAVINQDGSVVFKNGVFEGALSFAGVYIQPLCRLEFTGTKKISCSNGSITEIKTSHNYVNTTNGSVSGSYCNDLIVKLSKVPMKGIGMPFIFYRAVAGTPFTHFVQTGQYSYTTVAQTETGIAAVSSDTLRISFDLDLGKDLQGFLVIMSLA